MRKVKVKLKKISCGAGKSEQKYLLFVGNDTVPMSV